MTPEDRVKEAIRENFRFAASGPLRRRMLARVLQTQETSRKTPPALIQPKIRRITMKSPIAKAVVAAAVVIATIAVTNGLWNRSASTAYAFEQTVEAMQGKRSFHIQTYFQQRRKDEFWAEFDERGNLLRFRQEEDGGPKGPMVTLWEDNVLSQYYPPWGLHKMSLVENTDGGLEGLEEFDPETIVQEIQALVADGRAVMEIQGPAAYADLMTIHVTRIDGKPLRQVLMVDPVTKFVVRIDNYWGREPEQVFHKGTEVLEYNEIMDPGLFEPNFPEGTIIMDQVTQEVGLAQGDMTNEEVAVEICRQALDAWAQEDYAQAGKLFGGAPKRMLTERDGLRPLRIISIGQPKLIQYMTPRYWVQCEYEIERDGRTEVTSQKLGVFGVNGYPGRWYVSLARMR